MAENSTDFIPCMLLPLQHHYLLLPNSIIAEVTPMPRFTPTDTNKPNYWVGEYEWRSLEFPIIDLESLVEGTSAHNDGAHKLCILHGINDSVDMNVYGLRCYGAPQLIHLNESALKQAQNTIDSEFLHYQLQIGNKVAYIPNLDKIETILSQQ